MSFLPPGPQFAAFLIVAGLLTMTPGADMALVMRHALASGTRRAFFASLGFRLGVRRRIEAVTGAVLMSLGIRLALARR